MQGKAHLAKPADVGNFVLLVKKAIERTGINSVNLTAKTNYIENEDSISSEFYVDVKYGQTLDQVIDLLNYAARSRP